MDILGLSTSPSSGGAYALILNETDGKRRLPIIIGTFEAQAIALELENIKPPRPMTHDLMRNIIQSFNTFVKEIYINDLKEGTFYAQVVYDNNGETLTQDSRPSDAIALAIRFNAPIFVSDHIIDEAGIESDPQAEEHEESGFSEERGTESPAEEESPPASSKESRIKMLEKNLTTAIAEEDYEKAAKIRDELNRLKS
ncbi:bifunctional nuclease family protein [Natronogracilivirgula saccharolytica]|uniref:Bifunctional nuclease family protein n=2 Tax=Natronogracilivirga saccharolytica TaxID=2812953 RepID=A0A8J7UVD4_9BACT|nr:bifunctional nuclease family protein [Natronogracilivirga saccharolytica]